MQFFDARPRFQYRCRSRFSCCSTAGASTAGPALDGWDSLTSIPSVRSSRSSVTAGSRRHVSCEGVGGVQGALTLFCGGVAQTCHDDRVVELKEQLVVEEVDGEGQEGKVKEEGRGRVKENAPWMTWMECESAQDLSQ